MYQLLKPIQFDGKEITELDLQLEDISGMDICEAEKAYVAQGGAPSVLELSKAFTAEVAARACGVPVELIKVLKAKDFNAVTTTVQDFLLNTGLVANQGG